MDNIKTTCFCIWDIGLLFVTMPHESSVKTNFLLKSEQNNNVANFESLYSYTDVELISDLCRTKGIFLTSAAKVKRKRCGESVKKCRLYQMIALPGSSEGCFQERHAGRCLYSPGVPTTPTELSNAQIGSTCAKDRLFIHTWKNTNIRGIYESSHQLLYIKIDYYAL